MNTTAVPLTLSWKTTDSAALKHVRLTTPTTMTYGPTTNSAAHTAKAGTATTWSMTAYDQAGNTATASVTHTPVILQETAAVKTGTWATKTSTSYLGGQSYSSTSANASLTWTFTGKSAAWIVSGATTSGQAHVYVDGVKATTVDLKSSTTKYGDAIWTKAWATSAKHTVKKSWSAPPADRPSPPTALPTSRKTRRTPARELPAAPSGARRAGPRRHTPSMGSRPGQPGLRGVMNHGEALLLSFPLLVIDRCSP